MSTNATINFNLTSSWQLLAEFSAVPSCRSDWQVADQVFEKIFELGLPPLQLERIKNTVMEEVQRASNNDQKVMRFSPPIIRVWVAVGSGDGRSWGFFFVRRLDKQSESTNERTDSLMELFLYQEPLH